MAKAQKDQGERKTVVIPPIKKVRLAVELIGTTELITHRFGETARRNMEESQQKGEGAESGPALRQGKPPREPVKEFQESIYLNREGQFSMVAAAVKRAMVRAGQRFADETGTELMGALSVPAEFLVILGENGAPAPVKSRYDVPPDGWPRMREDMVRLGGLQRKCSIAYRPGYLPWRVVVPLVVNANFLNPDQALNLLSLAGFSVGVGDWRVECKGDFGQFEIGRVEEVKLG